MPAEVKEIAEAKEEGIKFLFQNNIVEIKGNQKVEKLELIKTKLVQREGETRAVPVNIEGSNYEINTDYVVMALGSMVSDEVLELGLTLNKWGNIYINENYQSSNSKIFAETDFAFLLIPSIEKSVAITSCSSFINSFTTPVPI